MPNAWRDHCRIWSDSKQAWWRPAGAGYTTDIVEAGVFPADYPLGAHSASRRVPIEAEA